MMISTCPNCQGKNLFASSHNTPANSLFMQLLPKSTPGRFRVVVCKDCGLTSLFASMLDVQDLRAPHWEKIEDGVLGRPLGLND